MNREILSKYHQYFKEEDRKYYHKRLEEKIIVNNKHINEPVSKIAISQIYIFERAKIHACKM